MCHIPFIHSRNRQIIFTQYPLFCVAVRPGYHSGTDLEKSYKMTSSPRGIALLFNMTKFERGWKPRHGSEEDVSLLKGLFRDLDFEVQVEENLPSQQLKDKLKSVTCKDHSSYDCFVMFIMSHGLSGKVVCSDGKEIQIDELRDMISECETLSGKPKLLFIDACRGELEEDEAPKHADFSVVFSTVDGYRSFKAINGGSLFVCSFVKVFRERKAFDDLDGILKTVIREVSRIEINNIEEEDQSKTSKQVPEVNYTLSGDLHF